MGQKSNGILTAVKKVRGGVRVSHNKNTANLETVRIPTPSKVVIPMRMHIGTPCAPAVNVGDIVSVGQIVGDSTAFVSAPIHATVSGKVTAVGQVELPDGNISKAVTIESDGEMRLFDGIEPPKVETREDFLKAVRNSGLVGLGGAGFPTHVKLGFPQGKIDTLVVNAAECEPYITVDYRECIENSWDILSSIKAIKELLDIPNVIIAIENNKPDAIEVLSSIASAEEEGVDEIKVMTLSSRFPQGAEKIMIQSATGRRVPPGGLPSDVGCVVMNVCSVAFIARYLKTGKPLVSRSLTVDGSAVSEPKNIRAPIGTNIGEIFDFCGGFKEEPKKIITGGPMMGLAVIGTDLPILKQNNALLAFTEKDMLKGERDCIRCGRCAFVCPFSLQPTVVEALIKADDIEALKASGASICMECGSCSYSCPAGKPLVQTMRLAKYILKEAGDKNER